MFRTAVKPDSSAAGSATRARRGQLLHHLLLLQLLLQHCRLARLGEELLLPGLKKNRVKKNPAQWFFFFWGGGLVYVLFVHKKSVPKTLYYFYKKLKIKKNPKNKNKNFGGVFLGGFFVGFFGWVFYWQPCLLLAQELLLGDAEVLQARALAPPLGRRLLALLHHLSRQPVGCGSGTADPYL